MTPERAARLVAAWVRRYTRDLPEAVAERRVGEVAADLHDQIAHERDRGARGGRIALSILSRAVRGVAADVAWRDQQVRANLDHLPTLQAAVKTSRKAYRRGLGLMLFSAFFLFWIIGAVGLIGVDGDNADRMYLGVFATGLVGTLVARLRARGMARVLVAMALAQTTIAVIALIQGKHENPVTSIPELVGLNAMFVVLFAGSALLFERAARTKPAAAPGGD